MFNTAHLHPMLVHFPIALVVFGFLAEIISLIYKKEVWLTKTAFYLLISGTLMACATWLSGILFTEDMSGAAGIIRDTHALFASITLGLLLITSVIRIILLVKKTDMAQLKWTAFTFYSLAAVSVAITGFYGGTLVYNYIMPL